MSLIKRSACVLLFLLFIVGFPPIKASAITVDGDLDPREWKSAEKTEIFPYGSKTNCDINFAFVHIIADEKANTLYLAFRVTQKTAGALDSIDNVTGIKLTTDVGKTILCRFDGTNSFDNTTYSVAQKMVVGTNDNLSIEMSIGYLFGVPKRPLAGLQLIDSYGNYSNYYKFPLVVETTSSTTPATTNPTTTKPPSPPKPSSPVLYKIKFDSNGGTGGKTQSLPYGAKPLPPEVNRKGYTFSAWSPQIITVAGAATYTAQWVKDKDKDSPTSPPTVQTTPGGSTAITKGTTAKPNNPAYTGTNPSLDGENEAIIHDEATSSSQSNSDKPESNSQDDIFPKYDTNEKDTRDNKKQIAAVVSAVILLSLAAYFFILASKHKTGPKPKQETTQGETDENDPEDDF